MNKKYDVFFFDLDGTIIDSSIGITNSVIHALKKYGIEVENRTSLYKFIGPPLTESFAKYYGFSEEKSVEAVEFYREYYRDKGIYEVEVYEGIPETVRALKQAGKKVVVATSKPEKFARQIIEHIGLSDGFDYVAGMEMNGGRNSKAEVIQYALNVCGIEDASKVLMIGDREHDVIGAKKAANMDCLGVLFGFGSREEFEEAGAAYIVETAEEILNFI